MDWLNPNHENNRREAVEKASMTSKDFTEGRHEAVVSGHKVFPYKTDANKCYLSVLFKGEQNSPSQGMSNFAGIGHSNSDQKYLMVTLECANIDTNAQTFGSNCSYADFLERVGHALHGKYFSIVVNWEKKPQDPQNPQLEVQYINKSSKNCGLNPRTTCAEQEIKIINGNQQASTAQMNPGSMQQMTNQQQPNQQPQQQPNQQQSASGGLWGEGK